MNTSSFRENKFVRFITNKYILTVIIFSLLFLFSPNNNIIYYFKVKKQYEEIEQQKNFILEEITKDSIRNIELERNIKAKEKYGREKYMMKSPNEDIYVIKHQETHNTTNSK